MAVNPASTTTVANTGRVLSYSTLASGLVYSLNKRTTINLDEMEIWLASAALAALFAFLWNLAKDHGLIKDNR